MIYKNILQTVGNTPIVEIKSFTNNCDSKIFAKVEWCNVGGSVKTRTAYNMILKAKEAGLINKNTVIVEPSSGNQGVGLALVGAVLGLKVIIIMPSSVSTERKKLITHYGARVITIKDDGDIGKCIKECINKAHEIKRANPNVYIPNQFENYYNVEAHYQSTASEIIKELGKNIDAVCLGVGSGGSITGIGRRLKEANPDVQIWAVEPEKGAILSGKKVESHIQMGIGDGIIPSILDREIITDIYTVADKTAIKYAKELAKREGLACGISSGSNIACAVMLAKRLGKGKRIVTLLPDGAEKYFSTPLFD